MSYIFTLDGIQLPVTPSQIEVKQSGANKTFTLINGQEINILKSPTLKTMSFSALLPRVKYPFARYDTGFKDAQFYITVFEEFKKSLKPFPFSIVRVMPDGGKMFNMASMLVCLEEYKIIESAENGFDVKADIELKEYKTMITKTVSLTQKDDGSVELYEQNNRESLKDTPKSYTVKKNDNLWEICRRVLGDGKRYKEIAQLNNIQNPNLIYPGQVIKFD